MWEAATICPAPCKLTLDLLTSKVVSESRVTWPTFVPILVFLGLSALDFGRCTRQTDVRRASSLNAPALWGRGHNKQLSRSGNLGGWSPSRLSGQRRTAPPSPVPYRPHCNSSTTKEQTTLLHYALTSHHPCRAPLPTPVMPPLSHHDRWSP